MAERRNLRFQSLDDIIADAENLHTRGYEKIGNWDLAQVCNHCACWVKYPMDGFPKPPLMVKLVFAIIKRTMLPKVKRQMKDERTFPPGLKTAPMTIFQPGQDDAAAVANLKRELERMKTFTGPMQPSPLMGLLSKEEWVDSHLVHIGHHLSFLVPKTT